MTLTLVAQPCRAYIGAIVYVYIQESLRLRPPLSFTSRLDALLKIHLSATEPLPLSFPLRIRWQRQLPLRPHPGLPTHLTVLDLHAPQRNLVVIPQR